VIGVIVATAATAFAFFSATGTGTASATADTVQAGNQPSGSATGTSVTISWTASTTTATSHAVDGYLINRYSVPSGGTPTAALNGCSGTINALNCTEASVPNGTWYYTVTPKLQNWLGAESARSSGIAVNVDTTPPVFTITTNTSNPYYSGTGTTVYFRAAGTGAFTVTASDPESGITSSTFPALSGWTRTTGTNSATYTRNTANASASLNVSATNGASLTTPLTVTITLDGTNPTQALSLTQLTGGSFYNSGTNTIYYKGNAVGSFTLTDTVTDGGAGPASADFPAIATGSWTHNAESGVTTPGGGVYTSSTFSWTANPSAPTPKVITGRDAVGNTVTTTVAFTVDNTAPTTPVITFPTSGGRYNASGWTGSITGSASDVASGVGQDSLTVQRGSDSKFWNGSAWQTGSFTLVATGTTSWTQALTAGNLTDGVTYTITAATVDNVGNTSATATATFVYDTTPPVVTITSLSSGGGSSKVNVSGTATFGDGNVTLYLCHSTPCSAANAVDSASRTVASDGTWSYSSGNIGSGTYYATATQTDAAGNAGSANDFGPFIR
jgi:hypothetical protein